LKNGQIVAYNGGFFKNPLNAIVFSTKFIFVKMLEKVFSENNSAVIS
jgi:hypothetical protein